MSHKPPLAVIVEDSPTQAKSISAKLQGHGLETIVAFDGPEGLRAIADNLPDLVVLDVNLPSMSGYQVCRRIKRDPATAHIPVVMLTVSENFDAMMEGIEAGADDYIPKDAFATENLISTLTALNIRLDAQ
ncbi:MAG: response regulator [Anaerolineae bacterium]|nr:response regulator [Anaerolineae bacterium]